MDDKKKIVIVDDEIEFATMVKMRLEHVGYDVSIAVDTYAGTHEIIKHHADLVVLDLMMPAGGGFTLLERLRKNPSTVTTPVVIVTAKQIDREIEEKAKGFRVAALFEKPYDTEEFVQTILSLVPA